MLITPDTRRRFMTALGNLGLGGTLLPGALLAQVQQSTDARVTAAMLANALSVAGLNISDDDQRAMLQAVNRNLNSYEEVRKVAIPNDVAPPSYFSPIMPGMKMNRTREPLRFSTPNVKRPPNLEDAAYWPILNLAHLIRTKQVTQIQPRRIAPGANNKKAASRRSANISSPEKVIQWLMNPVMRSPGT